MLVSAAFRSGHVTSQQPRMHNVSNRPPSQLPFLARRASVVLPVSSFRIYERKDHSRRAIEHHSRFVELWAECDPELQPMVRKAQQALARLG
jgi:hypothetical protein